MTTNWDAIAERVAADLNLKLERVRNTIELLDAENTVPFITRYRKEKTDGLDEDQIRNIQSRTDELRELGERSQKILKLLEDQGKLTPELRDLIQQAESLKRLDELYAPYRSKRKTRADEAREMGLTPLANAIWEGRIAQHDLGRVAANCVGKHSLLTSEDIVLGGAVDLIAGRISERVDVRDIVRNTAWKTGRLQTSLIAGTKHAETFQDYNEHDEAAAKAPPHRVLAIDRGESKKALRARIRWDEDLARLRVCGLLRLKDHRCREFLQECVDAALKRMVNPSIERELRRELSDRSQVHAVEVFSRNLRNLLLQPPLARSRVLAIDPGFRTGCKVVALDEEGRIEATDLIYVTPPKRAPEMREKLAELARTHRCDVIAIGNGTASRETEVLVSEAIQEHQLACRYLIVNEAGASIYSASEVGRTEFPDLDATIRGTVSIGRRLQDPLSELVKIDPQHIGVGMYQHDVSEKRLAESLTGVVESCVNHVGVDLNRASVELLKHVAGLNRAIATKIVAWRSEHGPFHQRADLLSVSGVGNATFTQAAGFLKIPDSKEPLDATWIHPESYDVARQLIQRFEIIESDLRAGKLAAAAQQRILAATPQEIATEVDTDPFTAQQILESLLRPGRDPREDSPGPLFRSEVLNFDHLNVGMQLSGVVTNVVDFGAFVDVGLKNDGLVHISKMSNDFVSSPYDLLAVGDVVTVWVDQLEPSRHRIGLSLLKPPE